jgi:polysaccharide export outer membrane protein
MSTRFLLLPIILIIAPLWAQEYTLGPGDVVSLSVPDLKEMDGSYRVNNMGNLELPYLKTVPIRGKTVLELKTIIEARLKANYLNDPQVLVKIEEVHANPISFIGAVARPGPIKESYEIDLLQALSLVGGRTENASSRALIIRRSLSGETATLEVDLNRLLNDGLPYLNIPLFAGDTVNIPNKVDVHIYITGEVNQPGELTFSDSDKLTLLRVISKAGGFTDYAKQRKIQIKRDNGPKTQEFTIDAKAIKQGKKPDFELKADDVIIIP